MHSTLSESVCAGLAYAALATAVEHHNCSRRALLQYPEKLLLVNVTVLQRASAGRTSQLEGRRRKASVTLRRRNSG